MRKTFKHNVLLPMHIIQEETLSNKVTFGLSTSQDPNAIEVQETNITEDMKRVRLTGIDFYINDKIITGVRPKYNFGDGELFVSPFYFIGLQSIFENFNFEMF